MKAIDRFAGTGWGVALKQLGIEEDGVELMPEAVATREAAGMKTIFHDVWDGLEVPGVDIDFGDYHMAIDSPPCQTFSVAGNGAGREALDNVLKAVELGYYRDVNELRILEKSLDPRTALVLTPMAYAYRDRTPVIIMEQVPPVLPVWEAYAEVLRGWGYSAWTGILNAEQYGVPQTWRRAILIARLDGEAKPPTPTHSRYYSRSPERLDPGVEKWVSMAEALGWASTLRSNYGTGGDPANRGERSGDEPAPTITSKAGRNKWAFERPATTVAGDPRVWPPGHKVNGDDIRRLGEESARAKYGDRAGTGAYRMKLEEAAALQTYPNDFPFQGGSGTKFLQIGNAVPPLLAKAIIEAAIS